MKNCFYDGAIIGAGTAGTIAAIVLAEHQLKVCVIDKAPSDHAVLSESAFIKNLSIFDTCGIGDILQKAIELETRIRFSDAQFESSIDMTLRYAPNASLHDKFVQINKTRLNHLLHDRALEMGVEIYFGNHISDLFFDSSRSQWDIESNSASQVQRIGSRFVLDASGKASFLVKKYQHRLDQKALDNRVACFSHFLIDDEHHPILESLSIIATDCGYLFAIPLSKNKISIGAVVSKKKSLEAPNLEQLFTTALELSPEMNSIVRKAKRVLPVIPIMNQESVCQSPMGPGYLICGEAAAFLDPFFSNGIQIAAETAKIAADTAYELSRYDFCQDSRSDACQQEYVKKVHRMIDAERSAMYSACDESALVQGLCSLADPHLPYLIQAFLLSYTTRPMFPDHKFRMKERLDFAREAFTACG